MKKLLLFLVLMITIVMRSEYEVTYADYSSDKVYQILAAKGINKELGYNLPYANPDNLSEYDPVAFKGYPPLYSYSIASLHPLLNYFNAALLIDVLAIVFLVLGIFLLLKQQQLSKKQITIALLFFAIVPFPFGELTSTDLMVSSIFIWIALLLIKYLQSTKVFTYPVILIAALSSITIGFKYSAYPLLLVAPLSLFVVGFQLRKRVYYYKGALTLVLSIVVLILLKLALPDQPKDKVFESGFYPKNLLQLDEFVFKSLFYVKDIVAQIGNSTLNLLLRIASLFVSAVVIIGLALYLFKNFRKKSFDQLGQIGMISFITLSVILCFLALLSLRTHPEMWQDPPWTYVEESRYYAPAIILLQLLFFVFLFKFGWQKNLKRALIITLLASFIYNGVYWLKQLKNGHFGNESLYTFDHNYSSLLTICDALQETPIENLVYADVNGYNNAFVSTITEVQIIPFDNLKKVSYSKPNVSYSIIVNCNEKELENLLANTKLMLKKELITSDGHRLYVVSLGE